MKNIINAVEKTMKKAGHLKLSASAPGLREEPGADILIGIIYYKNSMPAKPRRRKAAYSSARRKDILPPDAYPTERP